MAAKPPHALCPHTGLRGVRERRRLQSCTEAADRPAVRREVRGGHLLPAERLQAGLPVPDPALSQLRSCPRHFPATRLRTDDLVQLFHPVAARQPLRPAALLPGVGWGRCPSRPAPPPAPPRRQALPLPVRALPRRRRGGRCPGASSGRCPPCPQPRVVACYRSTVAPKSLHRNCSEPIFFFFFN